MKLYPVHLRLEGRSVLVLGAGAVAAAKVRGLIEGGARVRVIAPNLSAEMQQLVTQPGVTVERRLFRPADLDGVWLAVAATDDPQTQSTISREAETRKILLCIVDDPARSSFVAPAVLRRQELLVTVSTSGVAPAFAARLRDYLGEILGSQYGEVLTGLKVLRAQIKDRYPDFDQRRTVWYRLLDTKIMPRLREGRTELGDLELRD